MNKMDTTSAILLLLGFSMVPAVIVIEYFLMRKFTKDMEEDRKLRKNNLKKVDD
jgi:hypothetical protein